jgi:hypothetical protein
MPCEGARVANHYIAVCKSSDDLSALFFQLMFCLEPVIEIMSVNASTFEKDLVRPASNISTRRRRLSILPGPNWAGFRCLVFTRRFQLTLSPKERSPLNCVHERVDGDDPTVIRCHQHVDTSDLPRLARRTEAPPEASDTAVCVAIRQH